MTDRDEPQDGNDAFEAPSQADANDFEAMLARMMPPETPAGAIEIDPALADAVAGLSGLELAVAASALQTEPAYQANSIRFEWLTRLALALGRTAKRPTQAELANLINVRLRDARVTRLEDPIEDVMTEPVCTKRGDRLIFTGTWEKAGHFTETLLEAFTLLPDGGPKAEVLAQAHALLELSDAIVRRAALDRFVIGGGTPKGALKLPSAAARAALERRVAFTWDDLTDLGISPELLAPFILDPTDLDELLNQPPGASDLERQPLLLAEEAIVVVAPANLSTAVRALLIDTAIAGGMEDRLRNYLLQIQSNLIDDGGLTRIRGPVSDVPGGMKREHIEQVSLGRFLHVLCVVGDFSGWKECGFTTSDHGADALAEAVMKSVQAARDFAATQPYFSSGLSLVFLCGWGAGQAVEFNWRELRGWQVIPLEPHDGFILGGCDDASVRDLAWMKLQYHHVVGQGFEFHHVNGFLNLFQWWRRSDHAFVPPWWVAVTPPAMVTFDTDLLLDARREALLAWDRRMLALPSGVFARMMRMEPKSHFAELLPIYGSYDAARNGHIASAILIGERLPIWFELANRAGEDHDGQAFETFKALLQWCGRVLPAVLGETPSPATRPILVHVEVELADEGPAPSPVPSDTEIDESIAIALDPAKREARITLAADWQRGLQRADNRAEAALAARAIAVVTRLLEIPFAEDGVEFARAVVGGDDVRWRHWVEVRRVAEALRAYGLVERFEPIPVSISALVKTGVAWATHAREDGAVIAGKATCRAFLDNQVELLDSSLRAMLRRFRRVDLARAALRAMHAAQGDEQHWSLSARALRAIHGKTSDATVSLRRRSEINAVLRASGLLAELALVECPSDTGRPVGRSDLAELQAHVMLLVQTADLIPAVESGRIEPRFNISPTGDVLHDHGFEDTTVRRSGQIVHEAQRDRAARDYGQRTSDAKEGAEPNDPAPAHDLGEAITAEYGVDLDTYVSLAQGCVELAAERGEDVFAISRAELIAALAVRHETGVSCASLIDRLTMHPRVGSDQLPDGTTARDFDLAKLDRRFSIIGRPILALDAGDDPQLLVAPGPIERSILHNLQGAMYGTLQNEFWISKSMRSYASDQGRREGLRFNESVATRLRALGLDAYASAEPSWCFNHKRTQLVAELGDFDVLAITPDGSRAWIIEAKDLKLCRTLGETARRLSEYEGKPLFSGKPDKMMRHLRRVAYAREHTRDLQIRLKLPKTPEIAGIMVIRAPQPMETISLEGNPDAQVVMLANLDTVPWFEGWD